MNAMMSGKCDVCGKPNVILTRKYYHYEGVKCECCSYPHFVIVNHCNDCEPKEPVETKIHIKTEVLKQLMNDAEIGRATEKFFNLEADNLSMVIRNVNLGLVIANNVNELLVWAAEESEEPHD